MRYPQLRMLLYYIIGLLTMGLSAWLMSGTFPIGPALVRIHWFVALIPSIMLSILSTLICFAAEGFIGSYWLSFKMRHKLYRVSYLLNAIASGLAVGAFLAEKGMLPTTDLLLALMPAAALGILLCIVFFMPGKSWHKFSSIIFLLLAVALVIAGIVVWIRTSALAGCTVVFSGLFFLLFPAGVHYATRNPKEWYRYLCYTGFGAFLIIIAAVVIILSEGDILDNLDFDFSLGEGRSKKKRRK